MTKLAIAFAAAVLSLSACKSKSTQAGAPEAVAKMRALRDRLCACADATCARKVDDELVALTKQPAPPFTEAEVQTMAELGKAASVCLSRLTANADAARGSAAALAGSGSETAVAGSGSTTPSGLPKECDDYKSVVDHMQTCDALPKQARETLLKAFTDAAEGWRKHEGPDKMKDGVACRDAAAALAATGKARCGWQ